MDKVVRCLDNIFEFMNWDEGNLKENEVYIIYKKRIYDKKEVLKLIAYDYEKIFNF